MALTRGSKKRELDEVSGSARDGTRATKKARTGKKTGKKAGKKTDKKAVATKTKKKKGFLDMPPEIRNRIYEFASEESFHGYDDAAPLVTRCVHVHGGSQWPIDDPWGSARNFFGLTQTCKQLRREYRPLWLRNSTVRLLLPHVTLYLHSFFGCSPNYTDLPKLLQISYDKEMEDNINLTQLLRIRATCPTLNVEFVPHLLTLEEGPWCDDDFMDCELCEEEMILGDMEWEDFSEIGCPHDEYRKESFAAYLLEEEYPYLESLNRFIAHDNPKWLEDIRSREVLRVKMDTAAQGPDFPDVSIRLAADGSVLGKELENKTMTAAAQEYVNSRELKKCNTPAAHLHFELLVCASCGN